MDDNGTWLSFCLIFSLFSQLFGNCPAPRKLCPDGSCVPNRERLYCRSEFCEDHQRLCPDNTCVHHLRRCLGECFPSERQCADGTCVPVDGYCAGNCPGNYRKCQDGLCVPQSGRCFGEACPYSHPVGCSINSRVCLTRAKKCDGVKDCHGGEDEEGCGRTSFKWYLLIPAAAAIFAAVVIIYVKFDCSKISTESNAGPRRRRLFRIRDNDNAQSSSVEGSLHQVQGEEPQREPARSDHVTSSPPVDESEAPPAYDVVVQSEQYTKISTKAPPSYQSISGTETLTTEPS